MSHAGSFFTCLAMGVAASGCNLLFGIETGELAAASSSSTAGAGGSGAGSTGSGSGASGGSGGSGAGGSPACPAERVPPCHPAGGSGALCDAFAISPFEAEYTIGITVVGDHVYWANGQGQVVRASYDGSHRVQFGEGSDSIFVTTDADTIYWTDYYDAKIRGGKLAPPHDTFDVTSAPGDGQSDVGHITLRAGTLYWTGDEPNAVWAALADGTQATATLVADKASDTSETDVHNGIAADDNHVYWSDGAEIRRIPLAEFGNVAAIEVFALDDEPGELAIDDGRVYWTGLNSVTSQRKDKTDRIEIPTPSDRARGLLLDGAWIYWTGTGGRILRAKREGGAGSVQVVSKGKPAAYQLASDCGAIYFTAFEFSQEAVYKVRKPD